MVEREPLSRDRIVAAAIALADAEGIDAVSMRQLAAALGYEPMSLYNHVTNKDDLLAGMVDAVAGGMTLPADAPDRWRRSLHVALLSARDELVAHPWAAGLWSTAWPGEHRRAWMDGLLRCLRTAGFSVEMAHHGYHAVDLYVVGMVQQQLALPDDLEAAAEVFLGGTTEQDHPHLAEHVRFHIDTGNIGDDDFDVLLDLVLDGLERRRTASWT